MHLSEVSYFKARVKPENRNAFVLQLVKLNERKPKAMLALVKSMIAESKRLYKWLETTPSPADGNAEAVLERQRVRNAYACVTETMRQFTTAAYQRANDGIVTPLMACAWYWIKYDKILGTLRNHDKLRSLMHRVAHASDHSDIVALISKTAEIAKCDHCQKWEYVAKFATTYDESGICRACQGSGVWTYSDYYSRYVHQDDFRRAINTDGQWVYIHRNDEDFDYNDDADEWRHVDYVPPPPPILGNYHSSKAHQFPIVDDWSRERNRWFGVELEVEIHDHKADRFHKAKQIHEVVNEGERGKRAFFESDGSLSNGFEIVTQPMSLPMHQQFWNWLHNRDLVQHLRSHNTSTCGLHVHVNKDDLNKLVQSKIVTFVNDPVNRDLITAVARRYAEGYCKIKHKDLNNALVTTDRYEAVNVTGRRTLEFRIFKGSLKYESVMAAIEFVNALVLFAKDDPGSTADALKIDNFIEYINNQAAAETTTLRPYLNQRLERA